MMRDKEPAIDSSESLARPVRVVVVSPVHQWTDVRVYQKEALSLSRAGYEVMLLARPSAGKASEPTQVKLVPVPAFGPRALRFLYLPILLLRIIGLRGDVHHLHNPDTLALGLALKLLRRPVIYDSHEDFGRLILIREWIPRPLRHLIALLVGYLEWFGSIVFDATVVTQTEMLPRLSTRTIVIENPPAATGPVVEEAYRKAPEIRRGGELRLIYIGTCDRSRGLLTMVRLVAKVQEQTECRLWLIGRIAKEDLSRAAQEVGWEQVDYLGEMSPASAFAHVIRSDAGVILFRNEGDHATINPNKLYEYQLFGKPFLASSFGKWRQQLEPLHAGIFVDPEDPGAAAKAALWMWQHPDEAKAMGERGSAFIRSTYNWEREAKKLLALYEMVLSRRRGPGRPGSNHRQMDPSGRTTRPQHDG